jgi:predicted dinucleotide-binding enzyme
MNIAVLGTGIVGQTIASKLVSVGHTVKMGSRISAEKADEWVKKSGNTASSGTFENAATFGEVIFLATKGDATLEIIRQAKPVNFDGKTVIDISNPLDFSKGFPPFLSICNTNSLGEEVQKALPDAHVVKTLNTLTASLMVAPENLPMETDIFMSGNNAAAKMQTREILKQFGWKNITDLGDITTARGTEQLLPIWLRLYAVFGNAEFNFKIVKK